MKTLSLSSQVLRLSAWAMLAAAVLMLCSCRSRNKSRDADAVTVPPAPVGRAAPARTNQQPSILVAPVSAGKVARVNQQAKIAVLMFPIGQVPAANTRMVVYRGDAKIGEVKVTGPTQDNLTVGDIVLGSVEVNDEVREN